MNKQTDAAMRIALAAHAGQTRKQDETPYIAHPFSVALLLAQYGFKDTVIAAALVHDVLEDSDIPRERLVQELGEEITSITDALTEDKSLPWEERKRRYVESVRAGSEAVKAVSIADKIHNAQSIIGAYEKQGESIWQVFNQGRDTKLWFEQEMLSMFQETWQHPLVNEYEKQVKELQALGS